jgi:hypothetical protein
VKWRSTLTPKDLGEYDMASASTNGEVAALGVRLDFGQVEALQASQAWGTALDCGGGNLRAQSRDDRYRGG